MLIFCDTEDLHLTENCPVEVRHHLKHHCKKKNGWKQHCLNHYHQLFYTQSSNSFAAFTATNYPIYLAGNIWAHTYFLMLKSLGVCTKCTCKLFEKILLNVNTYFSVFYPVAPKITLWPNNKTYIFKWKSNFIKYSHFLWKW